MSKFKNLKKKKGYTKFNKNIEESQKKSEESQKKTEKSQTNEKPKKEKTITIKKRLNGFSSQYEDFYNNKKYSDITIKFEKSENIIHAHKFILLPSKVLTDLINETEGSEITIDENEDEETFKEYIKFMYTGKVSKKNLLNVVYYNKKVKK
jgi:hypothetical protein